METVVRGDWTVFISPEGLNKLEAVKFAMAARLQL